MPRHHLSTFIWKDPFKSEIRISGEASVSDQLETNPIQILKLKTFCPDPSDLGYSCLFRISCFEFRNFSFTHGMSDNHCSLLISYDNPCTSSSSFSPRVWTGAFHFGRYPRGSFCIPFFLRPHDVDGRKKRDQAPRRCVSMGLVLSFFHIV